MQVRAILTRMCTSKAHGGRRCPRQGGQTIPMPRDPVGKKLRFDAYEYKRRRKREAEARRRARLKAAAAQNTPDQQPMASP